MTCQWHHADQHNTCLLLLCVRCHANPDEPKWDTWGRLFEPLLSSVPMMHTDGNHERSPFPNGDLMTSYNARYPTPYLAGHDISKGEC